MPLTFFFVVIAFIPLNSGFIDAFTPFIGIVAISAVYLVIGFIISLLRFFSNCLLLNTVGSLLPILFTVELPIILFNKDYYFQMIAFVLKSFKISLSKIFGFDIYVRYLKTKAIIFKIKSYKIFKIFKSIKKKKMYNTF